MHVGKPGNEVMCKLQTARILVGWQACRQGGFEGVHLNPPPNNFIHPLAIHFKCPKWSTRLAANENHRFPNEFCLQLCTPFVHGGPVNECRMHTLAVYAAEMKGCV